MQQICRRLHISFRHSALKASWRQPAQAAAGFWAGKSLTTATLTPTVQTGTVALVGINGDEFAIRLDGQRQLTSYGLPSDITWRDAATVELH